jgi:hypothetical protein
MTTAAAPFLDRGRTLSLYALLFAGAAAAWVLSVAANPGQAGVLSLAFAFDLVLTSPLVYYLLVVRRGHAPAVTLLPVVGAGLALCEALLPPELSWLLLAAGALMGGVEALVLLWLLTRLRHLRRDFRAARAAGALPYDALVSALERWSDNPLVARLVGTELMVIYYGVAGWRRRPPAGGFTHYRECGWPAVFGVFAGLTLVEIPVMHLLLSAWSPAAAWVATALGIYSLIWLLGDLQAMRIAPSRVEAGALHLQVGMRWRARVPLTQIAAVELRPDPDEEGPEVLEARTLGEANLALTLAAPILVEGPFGIRREARRVRLSVDDPEGFAAALGHGGG